MLDNWVPLPITISEIFLKTHLNQPAVTCSKLTIEAIEQGVKYIESWQ